jgi:alpha-1,3-rhamnosyl/mannosyltransferase
VNLTWLRPGQVGGSESYLVRLLEGVAARHADDRPEVHLAVHPAFPAAHPGMSASFEVTPAPQWAGRSRPARVAAERTWLAGLARRLRPDVVHHAGGTVPAGSPAPAAVTVHDLQYLVHPEYFSAVKLAFLRRQVPRAARRARRVQVPSGYVATMVRDELGVAPSAVDVVLHGVPLPPVSAAGETPPVAGRYLLYPAVAWPHKNHDVVLRALAALPPGDRPRLVLTGASGPELERLRRLAHDLGVGQQVLWLGRVPYDDLAALYRGAVALVFPSRFEGFGAPVVEAMALGCPVVAADATALPEVVGPAGLLVGPDDVTGWAAAIERVARPEERGRLVALGLARAPCFGIERASEALLASWSRTAVDAGG